MMHSFAVAYVGTAKTTHLTLPHGAVRGNMGACSEGARGAQRKIQKGVHSTLVIWTLKDGKCKFKRHSITTQRVRERA